MSDFTIEQLNALPADDAEHKFLGCCGTRWWAQQMAACRPFSNAEQMHDTADAIFDVLSHPFALGTLCALAGAGLMVAPWLRQLEHLSATWWVDAFRDPELMQVIMALLCVALILSAGLAYRAATGHR